MKWLSVLFICIFISCKINQTKNGVSVGKWKYVSGKANDLTVIKGKYNRFGQEKGVWKYYQNDTLFRKETYYYPYSVDILFHKNGRVKEIGKAYTSNKIWTKYGTWYKFNINSILIDSILFNSEKTPQN